MENGKEEEGPLFHDFFLDSLCEFFHRADRLAGLMPSNTTSVFFSIFFYSAVSYAPRPVADVIDLSRKMKVFKGGVGCLKHAHTHTSPIRSDPIPSHPMRERTATTQQKKVDTVPFWALAGFGGRAFI